jgi:hypothetical protein
METVEEERDWILEKREAIISVKELLDDSLMETLNYKGYERVITESGIGDTLSMVLGDDCIEVHYSQILIGVASACQLYNLHFWVTGRKIHIF